MSAAFTLRLEPGRLAYRIDRPGLSPDEKAQGWVLPCVAIAQSDVLLRQPFQDAGASASMP